MGDTGSEELLKNCNFCHKLYSGKTVQNPDIMVAEAIFKGCCRHIDRSHLCEEFFNWGHPLPLPFCQKCYVCAHKLAQINIKLETVEFQIGRFVNNFTTEFLQDRKASQNVASVSVKIEDESLSAFQENMHPGDDFDFMALPEISEENVLDDNGSIARSRTSIECLDVTEPIKEEFDHPDYDDLEEADDLLYSEPSFGSRHSQESDEANLKPTISRRGRGRPKKSLKSSTSKGENLNIKVNLRRLQFDEDGNPIPDSFPVTRSQSGIMKKNSSRWRDYIESDSFGEGIKKERKSKVIPRNKKETLLSSRSRKNPRLFRCKICGMAFSLRSKLKIHLVNHREGRPFVCDECNFPFKDKESLRRHLDSHSTVREYNCGHCGKSYKYKRNLIEHTKVLKHHEDSSISCDLCEKALSGVKRRKTITEDNGEEEDNADDDNKDGSLPRRGRKRRDDQNATHVCEHCGKVCRTSSKLKAHMRIHTGEKNFNCDVCPRRFYDAHDARRHRETHFAERKYNCEFCDKSYKYRRNVKEHVIKSHPEQVDLFEDKETEDGERKIPYKRNRKPTPRKFQCPNCKEAFSNKSELYCHRNSHEPPESEPLCYDCDKRFPDLVELEKHMLLHLESGKFLCSYCGEQFRNQISQSEHEILHLNLTEDQIKEKYFSCTVCSKIFISAQRLKNHISSHNKERPFGPCEVCGATFKSQHIFKSHMRIHHTDRKKFQCPICEKLFSSKGCLNKHKYLHSEEKLFECFCGKKFSTKSGLTAHSVYHKSDKPYLCEECGQGYYTGTKLREHYRIHTGMLLFCQWCDKGFKNSTLLRQHHQVHDKSLVPNRPKRKRNPDDPRRVKKSIDGSEKYQHYIKKESAAKEGRKRSKKLNVYEELNDEHDQKMTGMAVEGILQFQCSICDGWFVSEDDINEHMNEHSAADTQICIQML